MTMWVRREQRSLGRHERLATSSDPTDNNVETTSEILSASTSSQEVTPPQEGIRSQEDRLIQEEEPIPISGESNSALDPQQRDQTPTENISSDASDINLTVAGRPSREDRTFLEDMHNDSGDEVNTSVEVNQLSRSRTIRRRRLFICIMILSLILLRLYIEAILSSDFALFWACLILTSWLLRWINSQRELLDGRMERMWIEDTRRTDDSDLEAMDSESRRRRRRRRRNRQRMAVVDAEQELNYRMLSFQAQLSMAIMESQRHILLNGGYGHPDGDDPEENRGVSEEAKQQWDKFEFSEGVAASKNLKSEDQSCCICLVEYETGDNLFALPCGHAYHKDCIDSWCRCNVKCPLCNFDLEEGQAEGHTNSTDETCPSEPNRHNERASTNGLDSIA